MDKPKAERWAAKDCPAEEVQPTPAATAPLRGSQGLEGSPAPLARGRPGAQINMAAGGD